MTVVFAEVADGKALVRQKPELALMVHTALLGLLQVGHKAVCERSGSVTLQSCPGRAAPAGSLVTKKTRCAGQLAAALRNVAQCWCCLFVCMCAAARCCLRRCLSRMVSQLGTCVGSRSSA